MIKGTRMIVITKNKILASCALIILLVVCMISVRLIYLNENITAFSDYKNIIDSQITPARKENTDATEKAEISEYSISGSILKHFFVLGSREKDDEQKYADPPEPSPAPLIQSEAKRIDKGLKISNGTSFKVDPESFLNLPMAFSIDDNGPQILIMHTHTTESYSEESYERGASDRDLDENKNIVAVGKAMAAVFKNNGIDVCHDTTVHDYPAYNGAYQRAAATINSNLRKYSGIKVVLDVHRDGITRDDGTKVKLVTEINGENTAQVMLVVGTNANLKHDNWQENFKFASQIQAKAIDMFPSLMRPIDLRQERFNEQLTTGSLILEIGANGNTLDEAIKGGERIAEVISALLKEQIE